MGIVWAAGQLSAAVDPASLPLGQYSAHSFLCRTGMTLQPTAQTKNAVWSWDFVHDVTMDGQPFRCLTVKDEKTPLVCGH